MSKTTLWIIIAVVVIILAIIGYILYRKKRQYDYVFKMMKQSKKLQKEKEEKEKKEAEFQAKRQLKSIDEAAGIVEALGGLENIKAIEQCAIRLRLYLVDEKKADTRALKAAGVSGVLKTTKNLQLIVGDRAEQIYLEINKALE